MKKPFTVGTRSLIFGAHAFWFHPFAVALGWWQLYGFPWHPALWLCFCFHDIGYIGSPNMDGPEGEDHPVLGAEIVFFIVLFTCFNFETAQRWSNECMFHSRHFAKSAGVQPSRLCMADKLATVYTPAWLYITGTRLTGELSEYMANAKMAKVENIGLHNWKLLTSDNPYEWYEGLRGHMTCYVAVHKEGQPDNVTEARHTV